ncbi:Centrosome-associated protein cep250 [Neofusicoccum parvum]|nr:Centrosome-associated protein cep250 [Neofusicoccum parvum]
MASSSAPQADTNVKVVSEPAVASWECTQRNETRFLIHPDPSCRVTCDIRVEQNTAFLRLRIPFMPNNSVRAKPIFLLVPPERVESARIASDVPGTVRHRLGDSIGLQLDLRQSSIVVVPSAPLVSKDQSTEDAVDALHSLALRTCFTIYLRRNALRSVEGFVSALSAETVRSHSGLADVSSLYSGRGGRKIEGVDFKPSDIVADATESPPSYDELALTPPRLKPNVPSKRRRRNSPDKDQTFDRTVEDIKKGLTDQLTHMVGQLGQQLEDRLLKRLDERLDERCEALREELSGSIKAEIMSQVEKRLEERLDERLEDLREEDEELGRKVRQLSQDIEDAKDEVEEIVDLRLDEQMTSVKEEMRTFVTEELKDVEDRVKDGITDGKVTIVFES